MPADIIVWVCIGVFSLGALGGIIAGAAWEHGKTLDWHISYDNEIQRRRQVIALFERGTTLDDDAALRILKEGLDN